MKYLFIALLLLTSISCLANDSTIVDSRLTTVVVYKTGANLTHTTSAYLHQGNNLLLIDDVSNQIDLSSIQIHTTSAITIMGIEFVTNYLHSSEKSPRMLFLEDSLRKLNDHMEETSLLIDHASAQWNVLQVNREIKGTQTGWSVAELRRLMDYYKIKSLELQTTLAHLKSRKEKEEAATDKLRRQLKEEEMKNVSASGRLAVQLSAVLPGKYDFTLSYITKNAGWLPSYEIRAAGNEPLTILYKAGIFQTTGLEWKQVKLTLTTALPGQQNQSPVLRPWFLHYASITPVASPVPATMLYKLPVMDVSEALQGRVAGVDAIRAEDAPGNTDQITIRGVSSLSSPAPLYVVDGVITPDADKIDPSKIKSIEVLKDAAATRIYGSAAAGGVILMSLKKRLDDFISVYDHTLDVSFDIALPYDVPSNGKPQIALLKTLSVPALYQVYAVPKLDQDPYLLAQVPGWEKLNLLPGEANIMVDDTYIGKALIDPASVSDTLNLTLGRDKRVVVVREKREDFSSVKFLGSNRLQKCTYEITVRNNKQDSIHLVLKDQFPISTDKEMEVELVDSGKAVVNAETGTLEWNCSLAPGDIKKVRFTYTIKCPKYKSVQ